MIAVSPTQQAPARNLSLNWKSDQPNSTRDKTRKQDLLVDLSPDDKPVTASLVSDQFKVSTYIELDKLLRQITRLLPTYKAAVFRIRVISDADPILKIIC